METDRRNLIVGGVALVSGAAALASSPSIAAPDEGGTVAANKDDFREAAKPVERPLKSRFLELFDDGIRASYERGDDYILEFTSARAINGKTFTSILDAEKYVVQRLPVDRPIRFIMRHKGFSKPFEAMDREEILYRLHNIGGVRYKKYIQDEDVYAPIIFNMSEVPPFMSAPWRVSPIVPQGEMIAYCKKPALVRDQASGLWSLPDDNITARTGLRIPYTIVTEYV